MSDPLLKKLTRSWQFKQLPKFLQTVELQDYAHQKKQFPQRSKACQQVP